MWHVLRGTGTQGALRNTLTFSGLSAVWDVDQTCKAYLTISGQGMIVSGIDHALCLMKDWDRVEPCISVWDFNICIRHLLADELLEIGILLESRYYLVI